MRFDDSLKTVLAADASTAFGAQATFRQLADLIARGRVAADDETLGRLRELREQVPANVRAAVARSFALGEPPAALVALFAEDELSVASAALRAARLPSDDWFWLMPQLGPSGRAVLRRRDDLGEEVARALASFGSTDFTLGYMPTSEAEVVALDVRPVPAAAPWDNPAPPADHENILAAQPGTAAADRPSSVASGFDIAELVDRIANYQQHRAVTPTPAVPTATEHFRFQTDAQGLICWTDATPRGAFIGAVLIGGNHAALDDTADIATRAFRQRERLIDAPLILDREGALGGEWRIAATPLFDPVTGQFIGYQGAARRPRLEQWVAQAAEKGNVEGLRRLVHELRTPTNAIAGFSELIETQLLGPVAPPYRERAGAIRLLAADLVTTIEDLDLAARMEARALELRPEVVALGPLLERTSADLQPLAVSRGCTLEVAAVDKALSIACDERAAERLLVRLIGTLVSAAQSGEAVLVSASTGAAAEAVIAVTAPRILADMPEERLLNLDSEGDAQAPGAPLLGTGFALRLVRNLALQLGGRLTIAPDRMTVALPSARAASGQAVSG